VPLFYDSSTRAPPSLPREILQTSTKEVTNHHERLVPLTQFGFSVEIGMQKKKSAVDKNGWGLSSKGMLFDRMHVGFKPSAGVGENFISS
jgi:hypothetical protein